MRKSGSKLLQMMMFIVIVTLIGCATQQEYQKAFDSQHSLTQNQCTFKQSTESIFMIAKQVFIQQGFTIESADLKSGLIKAVRDMQDQENKEYSYNIHVSADLSEEAGSQSIVSLAASQQTVLHRSTTTWWHLLGILPIIPTGTEYQTLVVKEGNITDPGFYTDFFNSLKVAVTKHDSAVKAAAAKLSEKAAEVKAEIKGTDEKTEADKIATEKANAEKTVTENPTNSGAVEKP